jgi:hypothetical protein
VKPGESKFHCSITHFKPLDTANHSLNRFTMTGLQKAYLKFLAILLFMAFCQRLATNFTDFTDGLGIALYGGPCESNICRRDETTTAEETSFFKFDFPFLNGHVTEFHAAEDYGFQSHASKYRFRISPEKLSELAQVKDLKPLPLNECMPWENADGISWWQPEGIANRRCYSAALTRVRNGQQHYVGSYELIYDINNKIAYLMIRKE